MEKAFEDVSESHRRAYRTISRACLRALGCIGMIAALTACPPKDAPVEPADPRLLLTATPSEQRVAQGATTLYSVTVERIGFTGNVSLAVDPATVPSGVTVEFDPAVLQPGITQSVVRVSVSPNARVQYVAEPPLNEIRVQATGPNNLRYESMLRVRLVASSLAGITLNVTPAELTMIVGEVKEALVTIARQGNYSGAVNMEVVPVVEVAGIPAAGALLAPTVTPVEGVPDTWLLRLSANNPDKAKDLVTVAALVGGLIPFSIRATPQGLPTVATTMRANLLLPTFAPTGAAISIVAGTQTASPIAISLNRSFRFTAPITMSIDSGPPGITGTFSPNPAVDDVVALTLRVALDVVPDDYVVRVLGVPQAASGASEKWSRVHVTVKPVIPYRINAPDLSLAAGSDTSAAFSLTRFNGFSGPVNVRLTQVLGLALPTGMTATLTQNPILQSATTLRITTTTATPPREYTLQAVGTSAGVDSVLTTFRVNVTAAAPTSSVARMELEPRNAEITAPATQQYRIALFDIAGNRITSESGGSVDFTSSRPTIASINASTGFATGVTAGVTMITARYVRDGIVIVRDSTPLTVYAAGSAGHYGSASISTNNNNTRTLRPGEPLLFQIIVRNAAGAQITTGVTPAPVVTSSAGSVTIAPCTVGNPNCPAGVQGYFYTMTAASNAVAGSTVRIRYDVMGAGGEITLTITP